MHIEQPLPPKANPGHGSSVLIAPDEKAFSRWLDLFRWIAALAVVFTHAENRFLVRLTDIATAKRTIPLYLFTFTAGFATQAVMIFFVLSGYLVGGGLWREAKKSKEMDIPRYLVKRVSRLCIVLYPTFILVILLNGIGIFAFDGISNGAYPKDILWKMRPAALVCNASFFQTALCDNYGEDGALWSLFNEFWYYILWPLILAGVLIVKAWKRVFFFVSASLILIFLTIFQFEGASVGPYMLIWLLGVGVALMPRPVIRSNSLSAVLFALALLTTRLTVRRSYEEFHPIGMFMINLIVSFLFANLLTTMKHNRLLRSPFAKNLHYTLAGFSFSLYCIHTSILNLSVSALRHYGGTDQKMVPDQLWKWGAILGAMALSVVIAFLFSLVTEAHTNALRAYLIKLLKLDDKQRWSVVPLD